MVLWTTREGLRPGGKRRQVAALQGLRLGLVKVWFCPHALLAQEDGAKILSGMFEVGLNWEN